MPAGI